MFARVLAAVVLVLCVAPAKADDLVVTEWLVLGTVPFDKDTDPFDTPPPPGLLDAAPVAGETFDEMTWQKVTATDNGHVSLLNRGWKQEEIVTAYLLTYLHSNAEGPYTVSVGSDDGIQVFSNGTEVHRNWTRRGWDPDQDRFTVRLQIGWNRLLLRVANYHGGFGASAVISESGTMTAGATRPSDYRHAEIAPHVLLGPTRFDPGLVADEAGKLAITAVTTVTNLGTVVAEPVSLRVTSDDATVGLSDEHSLPPGPTDIPMQLDPEIAARSVAAGTDLRLLLEWSAPMDEIPLDVGPQELLRIVSGDPPLREGLPVSSADMARLLDNWSWGARFRPELFADETDLRALLINYVHPDDQAFRAAWVRASGQVTRAAEAIKQQRITFVGNAHIDMAWLWDRAETIEVVDMTFDQALKFMDEFPFFNYAQSQMQAYAWTDELFPEMMQRLDAAVKAGRWIPVGGMWIEPDCNLPSGESFVRQLLYGKGWIRDRYGIDIRVGWNPDSFGYAWTLPMIFKGAGIDYFITQKIGWNDTTEFPHRLFWWQAPDGSRVLGYFPFTYTDDARPEKMAHRLAHQQVQQPGLTDMLNLYGVGDHGGGPTREMIQRYVTMSELDAFPAVEHATEHPRVGRRALPRVPSRHLHDASRDEAAKPPNGIGARSRGEVRGDGRCAGRRLRVPGRTTRRSLAAHIVQPVPRHPAGLVDSRGLRGRARRLPRGRGDGDVDAARCARLARGTDHDQRTRRRAGRRVQPTVLEPVRSRWRAPDGPAALSRIAQGRGRQRYRPTLADVRRPALVPRGARARNRISNILGKQDTEARGQHRSASEPNRRAVRREERSDPRRNRRS
jgi:hypothetical protein